MAQDEDLLSLTGTEIADCYNMSLNELESAADEVARQVYFKKTNLIFKMLSLSPSFSSDGYLDKTELGNNFY